MGTRYGSWWSTSQFDHRWRIEETRYETKLSHPSTTLRAGSNQKKVGWGTRQRVYINLRRSIPARPSIPEPNSTMLVASGVVPPLVMVNDSENSVPRALSDAIDGQLAPLPSLPPHPTPRFSSQNTGLPLGTIAFCRLSP